MSHRFAACALVLSLFGIAAASADAQTPPPPGDNGRPLITAVDTNNQVSVAPASDLIVVDRNVGLGTVTPAHKLDVVGRVNASAGLCMAGECRTTWTQAGTVWGVSGANAVYPTGSVGIGTTAPVFRLDVQGGQVNASGGLCISGDCRTAWSQIGGSQWTTSGGTVSYGGNVGIGTVNPGAMLDVRSDAVQNINWGSSTTKMGVISYGAAGPTIRGAAGQSLRLGANDVDGHVILATNGNVGVGTATTDARLQVYGANGLSTSSALRVDGIGAYGLSVSNTGRVGIGLGPTPPGAMLDIYNGNANTVFLRGNITGSPVVDIGYTPAGASYITTDGGRPLHLQANGGNVGIGTNTPAQKLHVVGNIVATGSIAATYQDVAEWVETSVPIGAATVVVADPDRDNQVVPSSVAYDTAVAGVISVQPGVLLGVAGDDKVAVAQSGRVLVKVDASYGPIKRGDLLVSSPTPGHAMRSEPVRMGAVMSHRPGTIVGKALQPLASGTGEILVLLTLQ